MKNILVIGAGQLGGRHLQALALFDEPLKIIVIDPSQKSRESALERFKQIPNSYIHSLELLAELTTIDSMVYDFAVIATNSTIRATVVKNLLQHVIVKNLLLEKFLFQRESDYYEIGSLLKNNKVRTFVNCPRRLYPDYKNLKSRLKADQPMHMEVVGNNWGLGCNGVHFIDLFQWLTNENITKWTSQLDAGYFESKRPGFVEFSGKVDGYTRKGDSISLISYKNGPANISVRLSSLDLRQAIEESLGIINEYDLTVGPLMEKKTKYAPLYQSELTNIVLDDLVNKGTCGLTTYEDSLESHIPFLQLLLNHFNMDKQTKTQACPIT